MKQVIVIAKYLKCRKGKLMAQSAHASLSSYLCALGKKDNFLNVHAWLTTYNQTKIVVGVESERELLDVYEEAKQAGLPCALIKDAGKTEFKEETFTAVGIGPANSEEIDKITGHLKLL